MTVWPRSSFFSRQFFSHRSSLTLPISGARWSALNVENLWRGFRSRCSSKHNAKPVATAITTKDGNFIIKGLAPGHYTLRLNAVGYRLITVEFSLAADEAAQEFDITLAFTRWKLALYGELLNLTNHNNPRYFYTSQNPDGTFKVVTGQGLPIVPTAGVAFEF